MKTTLYLLLSESDDDTFAHSLAYDRFLCLSTTVNCTVSFLKNMNSNLVGTRRAAGWPIKNESPGGGIRCSQPLSPATGRPCFSSLPGRSGPRERPQANDTPGSSPRYLFCVLALGGDCSLPGRPSGFWKMWLCAWKWVQILSLATGKYKRKKKKEKRRVKDLAVKGHKITLR